MATSTDFPITKTSIHVIPYISWGYMDIIPGIHPEGGPFPSPPSPPGEQTTQITPRESMLQMPLAGNMEEEWAMGEDSIRHVSGKTGQRCLTVSHLFSVVTFPWVQCGSEHSGPHPPWGPCALHTLHPWIVRHCCRLKWPILECWQV